MPVLDKSRRISPIMMKHLDLHVVFIVVLGLLVFGAGLATELGVLGVLLVSQCLLLTKLLRGSRKDWMTYAVKSVFTIAACVVCFIVIRSYD